VVDVELRFIQPLHKGLNHTNHIEEDRAIDSNIVQTYEERKGTNMHIDCYNIIDKRFRLYDFDEFAYGKYPMSK
jgi:tRNA A37 threonylcarbamoyladenosine biosynthesis protein TsaE